MQLFSNYFLKQTGRAHIRYTSNNIQMNYTFNTSNRPSSYKKLSYTQKLAIVNSRQRRGDVAEIAYRTDYSTTHVSDVLSGKEFNERILNATYDLLRNRKANSTYVNA